jgi:hypothetical protein
MMLSQLQSVGNAEVAPSNWNEKRSPMLPWLPAARKKRFPVAKRSPKETLVPETSEKVNQDLKGIFGTSNGEKNGAEAAKKKKRSSDTMAAALGNNAKPEETSQVMHEHVNMHAHNTQKKRKRDASDSDDDDEPDNDNGEQSSTRFRTPDVSTA